MRSCTSGWVHLPCSRHHDRYTSMHFLMRTYASGWVHVPHARCDTWSGPRCGQRAVRAGWKGASVCPIKGTHPYMYAYVCVCVYIHQRFSIHMLTLILCILCTHQCTQCVHACRQEKRTNSDTSESAEHLYVRTCTYSCTHAYAYGTTCLFMRRAHIGMYAFRHIKCVC
jgi:hypothetical protein